MHPPPLTTSWDNAAAREPPRARPATRCCGSASHRSSSSAQHPGAAEKQNLTRPTRGESAAAGCPLLPITTGGEREHHGRADHAGQAWEGKSRTRNQCQYLRIHLRSFRSTVFGRVINSHHGPARGPPGKGRQWVGLHCPYFRLNHPRFIPAPAGNSLHAFNGSHRYPVHPRACGEQRWPLLAAGNRVDLWTAGSSPRLRGTGSTTGGVARRSGSSPRLRGTD